MKYLRYTLSATPTWTDGVEAKLSFDEVEESRNMSLSTGRYTCTNPYGELIYYSCLLNIQDVSTELTLELKLKKNGTVLETIEHQEGEVTDFNGYLHLSGIIPLLNTDYIEFFGEITEFGAGSLTGVELGTLTEDKTRLILCEIPTASGNVVGAA